MRSSIIQGQFIIFNLQITMQYDYNITVNINVGTIGMHANIYD